MWRRRARRCRHGSPIPSVGKFSNDPSLFGQGKLPRLRIGLRLMRPRVSNGMHPPADMGRGLDDSRAGHSAGNAASSPLPASGDIDYTYEIVQRISQRAVGTKWRKYFRRNALTSTMRWCMTAAGFSVAAHAPVGTPFTRIAYRSARARRSDVDRQRHSAGLRARKFSGQLACDNGKVHSSR